MRATIKDIAAKTNLSIATVSMVLNGKAERISEKTRERVLKTAQELQYRPNQLAVGLIKKRTKTIGLIVPDIRNSFFSTLAKGIEDECRKNGWTVILCNTSDKHERDIDYINVLSSRIVDGILYCMSADSSLEKFMKSYELLNKLNIPFIIFDRSFQVPNCITATLDHVTGGYLATKHLLELGHKRIACVTGPNNLYDSNCRLEGYMKALQEAGIAYDESIITEGDYTLESGIAAVEKLLGKDFSAIFAFNDMMACGVYKGLKANNLIVPDDISVMGYDDIFLSEIFEVPLSTIHQPVGKLGTAATRYLIDIIEGNHRDESIPIFPPELVVRKSTTVCKPRRLLTCS